jgi:hypothetical protein
MLGPDKSDTKDQLRENVKALCDPGDQMAKSPKVWTKQFFVKINK